MGEKMTEAEKLTELGVAVGELKYVLEHEYGQKLRYYTAAEIVRRARHILEHLVVAYPDAAVRMPR